MLCVSFSSKFKATNIILKHILKFKAHDQSIQARKKLFFHLIVNNYLCNIFCKFLIKIESTWRCNIKEQTSLLTSLYCDRTVKSSYKRCSMKKKLFLNISKYSKEITVLESFFKKVKKRRQHRFFCVYCIIFKAIYLERNLRVAAFLTASMVYCYMGRKVQGLDCIIALGFRIQITGLVFCFKVSISSLEPSPDLCLKSLTDI